MRAVVLERTGGPEELVVREVPEPELAADLVLVRVRAAGVCGRDLIDRRGGFPLMKLPTVLGHEFAGDVVGVGSEVRDIAVGDRVANLHRPWCGDCPSCVAGHTIHCERAWQSFGHTIDGAYAEMVAAPARALVKIPEGVGYDHAASLGCTAAVALRALGPVAGLGLGESVLVTGASGGVGLMAIQLAKLTGARVVATTSSARKQAALRDAGADEVLVLDGGSFAQRVKDLTDGGAHVALELTGAATFRESLRSLRTRGRLVVIGNIDVSKVSVALGPLILFAHRIEGARSYSRADLETCFQLVLRGQLAPVIDRTLPLESARAAHELLEAREVCGRVLLIP